MDYLFKHSFFFLPDFTVNKSQSTDFSQTEMTDFTEHCIVSERHRLDFISQKICVWYFI